jgi:flavin-dependent dehydrogenase
MFTIAMQIVSLPLPRQLCILQDHILIATTSIPTVNCSENKLWKCLCSNWKESILSIKGETAAGYILNKASFLERVAEKAVESHVHIHMNHEVTDFKRGHNVVKVKTSKGEFKARLVVGANGFASIVSRKFSFEKAGEREIIPCI